jgi:ribosomal protein S2
MSYGPCHEAHKLKIPCLGIVDTDSPLKLVSIAIPGNDESILAVSFYNTLISTFILYKKFKYIHT